MAHIVFLHHRFDSFWTRRGLTRFRRYMMGDVLEILLRRGHTVSIADRPERVPAGDLLILHVDSSIVPDDYLAVALSFPVSINGCVRDITKRAISGLVVGPDSDWEGPVVVKSNLNSHGRPERRQNRNARLHARRAPHRDLRVVGNYGVHETIAEVPREVWSDPFLVVEKFMPERHGEHYGARTYIFCGATERCALHLSASPIVKGAGVISSTPTDIPDGIREIRARLGFDYGKFDFVMHDGKPVLLDANKTLGNVPANGELADRIRAANDTIADGVEGMLPG